MSSLLFLLLLVGFAVGALVGVLTVRRAGRGVKTELEQAARERDALRGAAGELRIQEARLEAELAAARERQSESRAEAALAGEKQEALLRELRELAEQLAQARAELAAERTAGPEKLALVTGAREELADRFKTLASEIFEEKSQRFTDTNRTSIDQLLTPLRERLGEFQARVEELKVDGVAGRSELKTHIEGLRSLNERLSVEASGLVAALKGSSKTQGDWGEMLLERMLEDCGMRQGQEYLVQESYTREDGTRARPDVILKMPGGQHLVIDAKVSLVDYNAYCACADEASRAASLARHVGSVRQHFRGLSKRRYQEIYELQAIDFVVMFVPIEPAYLLALSRDGRLWQEAWANDVLLVSPGTLFPVLRTVAHLWRQERQVLNVQEIVDRGALLYDKLAAFAVDLVKVGAGLETARGSYEEAVKKLSTGRGNVIRQAEMLKELGVKTSKPMPRELVEVQEELPYVLVEGDRSAGGESSWWGRSRWRRLCRRMGRMGSGPGCLPRRRGMAGRGCCGRRGGL
jgi:DNA recombination protein RmuC